uniref:Uncharacterized protein n=1 Tax=Panagrolaimus sp. ES5 TaxID=591445 RepID=A0AC34GPF3_9BILA
MNALDEFLHEGERLHLDSLKQTPNMNNLILLTTTETSSLLAQVAERIDDIRRLGAARRDALHKLTETTTTNTPKNNMPQSTSLNSIGSSAAAATATPKPVQVVSPEKKFPITSRGNSISSNGSSIASSPTGSVKSPLRVGFVF